MIQHPDVPLLHSTVPMTLAYTFNETTSPRVLRSTTRNAIHRESALQVASVGTCRVSDISYIHVFGFPSCAILANNSCGPIGVFSWYVCLNSLDQVNR